VGSEVVRPSVPHRAEECPREIQRLEKLLDDPGIKLSSVVSDLGGKSARTMVEALIAGERAPRTLAQLAVAPSRTRRSSWPRR
jgi:transposase